MKSISTDSALLTNLSPNTIWPSAPPIALASMMISPPEYFAEPSDMPLDGSSAPKAPPDIVSEAEVFALFTSIVPFFTSIADSRSPPLPIFMLCEPAPSIMKTKVLLFEPLKVSTARSPVNCVFTPAAFVNVKYEVHLLSAVLLNFVMSFPPPFRPPMDMCESLIAPAVVVGVSFLPKYRVA